MRALVSALILISAFRARAAVVEDAAQAAAAPSVAGVGAIAPVPSAATLSPALSPATALSASAIGAALGAPPGMGPVRLAPAAAASPGASAAVAGTAVAAAAPPVESAPVSAQNPGPTAPPQAPASRSFVPPPGTARASSVRPVAAPSASAAAAASDSTGSMEAQAESGRDFWDRSRQETASVPSPRANGTSESASVVALAGAAPRTAAVSEGGLAAPRSVGASLEPWRDAVAGAPSAASWSAGMTAAVRPPTGVFAQRRLPAPDGGAAPSAARTGSGGLGGLLQRLTLRLGSGLSIDVRAAAAAAENAWHARSGARAARVPRSGFSGTPPGSTLWLERRGLLETAALPAGGVGARNDDGAQARAAARAGQRAAGRIEIPRRTGALNAALLLVLAFLPAAASLLRDPWD